MDRLGKIALVCLLLLAARGLEAADGQNVVMRTASGRYLRTEPDGSLRAQRWFPTEEETFQLIARDAGGVSLKDFRGRWLLLAGPAGRTLRAAAALAGQPLLVSETGEGRVTLQVPGAGQPLALDVGPAPKSGAKPAEKPAEKPAAEKGRPEQTLEIYDASEIPASLRSTLASLVRGLLVEELHGKEYDKLTTHKREKYIDLPTLRDPRQEKRHRLLSYEEQYQVKARLDGTPQIEILHMPYLENHVQRGSGRLIFVVQASLPVSGAVRYAIPKALAASTHFHFIAHVALTGEICSGRLASLQGPRHARDRGDPHRRRQTGDLQRPVESRPQAHRGPGQPRAPPQRGPPPPAGQRLDPQGLRLGATAQPAAQVSAPVGVAVRRQSD
jgi:hypothetical protein